MEFFEIDVDLNDKGRAVPVYMAEMLSVKAASATVKKNVTVSRRRAAGQHVIFAEMREIGKKRQKARNSSKIISTYAVGRANTFVQQARFMENFTDNFASEYKMQYWESDINNTLYENMSEEQLRTYFTWRTHVRQGTVNETCLHFVYCYIYELINNIGVSGADDCVEKLIFFWNSYRQYSTHLDSNMHKWLRDYYIVNHAGISSDYVSIKRRTPFPRTDDSVIPKLQNGIWDLRLLEMNSKHKITEFGFFRKMNKPVVFDCVSFIACEISKLFFESGAQLTEIFAPKTYHKYYHPFSGAIYGASYPFVEATVKLSEFETYRYKDAGWIVEAYDLYSFPETKGFVLKSIEIKMREALSFAALKPPSATAVLRELKFGRRSWADVSDWRKTAYTLLKSRAFNKTITDAIRTFRLHEKMEAAALIVKKRGEKALTSASFASIASAPVEIDMSRLDRIWDEHLQTAAMLDTGTDTDADRYAETGTDRYKDTDTDTDTDTSTDSYNYDDSSQYDGSACFGESGYSGITGLYSKLSERERSVVSALLIGADPSDEPDVELLIEAINEKALDTISDNLIECAGGSYSVYEEYLEELQSSIPEVITQ